MILNRAYKSILFSILVVLSITALSEAQTRDQEEQDRSRTIFQTPASIGGTQLFIDEIGLSFLSEVAPGAGYFDRETYILGPQDVLSVDIKGPISVNARALVINSSGYLFMPYTGNIKLAGLTLQEAEEKLDLALREELTDFEMSITIQKARPVEVQIIGDIPYPGNYKIPAGSRLDYALFPALFDVEPSDRDRNNVRYRNQFLAESNYSLRNLKIQRVNPSLNTDGDLISYFKGGVQQANPFIYDGDVIRVQQINENSPRVSISGAVQESQEVEYRKDDTIASLLTLSSGFQSGADTTQAKLFRRNGNQTAVHEISLSNENLDEYLLQPNDRLIIPYLEGATRSASAWVYGEVTIPGNFPIVNDETTLKELLNYAGGLTPEALPNGSYLIRTNLTDRNVQSATALNTRQIMRTSDQIRQGFEYLEMEQQLGSDRRLFVNLKTERDLKDIRITDGDRLYIPRDYQNVVLYGQLNNPGNYPFNSSLTVRDYIEKAGGFSISADTDRIFIIKAGNRAWKNPSETTLESGDMIYVDRTPFDELNAMRNYDIQLRNLRRSNLQLILTTVSTITAVVTTYVAITR